MTRGRYLHRGVVTMFLAATAACSLTAGFDGFVGQGRLGNSGTDDRDADVAVSSDAVVPTGDAGGGAEEFDAASDTDVPDPNVPPVFVDGGTFCTQPGGPTGFCEDFDTADLSERWLREGVFGKLTSYAPRSAPNVFVVDAPPSTSGGTFVSKITRAFDTSSTSVVVGFDLKPERINVGSSFFILAAIEWTKSDAKYSLRMVYSNGQVRIEESNLIPPPNNKDSYHPFFNIPLGVWSRVTLDVVLSGGSPGAQLLLDGIAVGTREGLTPTANIDPRPTLILGAVYAGSPHTGWTLRYDDVTLTLR